ncbi:MAG: DUF58 domain-containing protein [Planctomycetes bacterium]|nr:DUF58 domain-containing protein [Planctomycetota bacterium]
MADSFSTFFVPDIIEKISRLDIAARHIVEGFLAGRHRSPYKGSSVEFAEHREYVVGDDTRHLDWKVFARTDRLYVRQFEEETNLRVQVLLDVSESMAYGAPALSKLRYGSVLAASICYLAMHLADAAGLCLFDDDLRAVHPATTSKTFLPAMAADLEAARPVRRSDLAAAFRAAAKALPRRALVVIISDLLDEPDRVLAGLRLLRFRPHEVAVFHLLHEDEWRLPFDGLTRFEGLESAGLLTADPRGLRDSYLAELGAFQREVREGCVRHEIDYVPVSTADPVDAVLSDYLAARHGGRR